VSVLRRFEQLPDESRKQILDDLDLETRELTTLVNELVDLATDRAADELPQRVVLADIAGRVAERAQRRSGREVHVSADASVANVRINGVERAVQNLVDNAVKFSAGGPVHLSISNGRISVRDHGPGLAPGDDERIFQRFYRAVAARSLPGSGLGLSIVSSVAEAHGGTVFARNAPGGGAEIGFTLPLASPLVPLPPPSL
jgi:two-component system sensor histidine kinase MprB